MLADDFLKAAALAPPNASYARHFGWLAQRIKRAQRFEIASEARHAMRSLLLSKPSSLVEAASFARPPFETCWFEWTPPPEAKPVAVGQYPALRVAALVETLNDHAFRFCTLWKLSAECENDGGLSVRDAPPHLRAFAEAAGRLGVSSMMAGIDTKLIDPSTTFVGPEWKRLRSATDDPKLLAALRDDDRNAIGWALKSQVEYAALRKVERSVYFRVNEEGLGYETFALGLSQGGDKMNLLVKDLEDEIGGIFSILILMNAKNCVDIKPVTIEPRLNKARRKNGKPELLDYSVINIRLNRAAERAHASGEMTREEARMHVVRGHFKIRKSGVYWWRPHWRGDEHKGVVARKGHLVT